MSDLSHNDYALRSSIQYDVWEEVDRQDAAGEPANDYVRRDILIRIAARTFRVLERLDREERAR